MAQLIVAFTMHFESGREYTLLATWLLHVPARAREWEERKISVLDTLSELPDNLLISVHSFRVKGQWNSLSSGRRLVFHPLLAQMLRDSHEPGFVR